MASIAKSKKASTIMHIALVVTIAAAGVYLIFSLMQLRKMEEKTAGTNDVSLMERV